MKSSVLKQSFLNGITVWCANDLIERGTYFGDYNNIILLILENILQTKRGFSFLAA